MTDMLDMNKKACKKLEALQMTCRGAIAGHADPRVTDKEPGYLRSESWDYLRKLLPLFDSTLRNGVDLLLKALPIAVKRGFICTYEPEQDAFGDWLRMRFPLLLGEGAWNEFRALGSWANLPELETDIDRYVCHRTDLDRKSGAKLGDKERFRWYCNWDKILQPRQVRQEGTDYWRLAIPLRIGDGAAASSWFGNSLDQDLAAKVVALLLASASVGEKALIVRIAKDLLQDRGVMDTVDTDPERGAFERFVMDRDVNLPMDGEERRRAIASLFAVFPRPPFLAFELDVSGRQLATVYLEAESTPDGAGQHGVKQGLDELCRCYLGPALMMREDLVGRERRQGDIVEQFGSHFFYECARSTGYGPDGAIAPPRQGDPLRPILYSAKHGFYTSEELALKAIVEFWTRQYPRVLRDESLFRSFQDAQRLLFWLEKYRDHLVHSLKVYLLGRAIVEQCMPWFVNSEMFRDVFRRFGDEFNTKNTQKAALRQMEVVRFAWAAAAFQHDLGIGLENLGELTQRFVASFTSRDDDDVPSLSDVQHGFSRWFVRDKSFHALFAVLQALVCGDANAGRASVPEAYNLLKQQMQFPMAHVFEHLLGEGDHGVCGAIVHLYQVFPKLHSPKDTPGKKTPPARSWARDALLHFRIAEAIMMHNLAFELAVKPDPGKRDDSYMRNKKSGPVFLVPSDIKIEFDKNPLSYLLALCDTLQDWGRAESDKPIELVYGFRPDGDDVEKIQQIYVVGERPYAHIESISTPAGSQNPTKLVLEVDYRWIVNEKKRGGRGSAHYVWCPFDGGDAGGLQTCWQHKKAPKGCRTKEDNSKDWEGEFDCTNRDGSDVDRLKRCKAFMGCLGFLRMVLAERLRLGGKRTIELTVKYRGRPYPDKVELL